MSMRATAIALGVALFVAGCKSPLERSMERALREQLVSQHRAYLKAVAAGPVIEIRHVPSIVEKKLVEEGRIGELDRMSGPTAYEQQPLELGPDLTGQEEAETVRMTLQQVIHLAARSNLDVQVARLLPAISQAQITQAEAAFDAVYFADLSYSSTDTPAPPSPIPTFGATQRKVTELTTGIRKSLTTGGQVTLQTTARRQTTIPSITAISTFDTASVELSVVQPVLRNFGSDVTLAQVYLSRNARAADLEDLRQALLDTVAAAEQAYWNLVLTRQRLLIALRLLERTEADRDQLDKRGGFDASPVQITEVNSDVERRRAEVIRARQDVRRASDALKRLINSKDLPVAGETLIVPVERPVDLPIAFSLLDAVTTGLRHRPEMNRALLLISDASIRQRVADNQRLPVLNLGATIRYNGLGNNTGEAFRELGDGDFIDYLLSAQFEVPIGNRGPEAQFRRFQLERQTSVVAYQRVAQDVVTEIKDALRDVLAAHELIAANRAARRAAADNLRAIEAQEDAGVDLTPEFLDLKLRRQEVLAETEFDEIRALTGYNIAIANFYRTTGTLLERNGITFADEPIKP